MYKYEITYYNYNKKDFEEFTTFADNMIQAIKIFVRATEYKLNDTFGIRRVI